VDLRAARLEIALEPGSPRPDLVGALESVILWVSERSGCHPPRSFRGRLRGGRHGRAMLTEMNEARGRIGDFFPNSARPLLELDWPSG